MSGDEGMHVNVLPAECFRVYLNTKQQRPGITGCSVRWDCEIKYGLSKDTEHLCRVGSTLALCLIGSWFSSLLQELFFPYTFQSLLTGRFIIQRSLA